MRKLFCAILIFPLPFLTYAQTSKEPQSKEERPYQNPKNTFTRWREAAIKGDIDGMVACYVSNRQKSKRAELKKIKKEILEQMQTAAADTKFASGEPYYDGDRATLEVNWTKGLFGDSQSLQFRLEK